MPSDTNATLAAIAKKSPYYAGKHADKVCASNGACVSDAMFEAYSAPDEKSGTYLACKTTHHEVVKGVHSFNVGSIINAHVIETENGLVVYDTGDGNHEADMIYNEIRKVTDKPIKAIMFSHEHYAGGSTLMVKREAERGNKDKIQIIGHHGHNASVAKSLAGIALHKEASDVLFARSFAQFYSFCEKEGPNAAGYCHHIDFTASRFYEDVNTPITEDGQKIVVDGTEFVCYIDDITTDTAQQMMVYMPEKKVCMNNIIWGFFPNIYSVRGGAYRNPEVWTGALEKVLTLDIDVMLTTHAKSITRETQDPVEFVQQYQDAISTVLHQTIKGVLLGKKPNEIAYEVEIPKAIENAPHLIQNYGEVVDMVPQIYSAILGTFDGDAADIIPQHPTAEADMIVRLGGGPDKTLEFAKAEFTAGNFLNAVQLAKHLYEIDSEKKEHVEFYVKALQGMAGATSSHNSRSWFLTKAEVVKGKVSLPSAVPQEPANIVTDVADFVDNYRVRLDHKKAGDTKAMIGFSFANGVEVGLEIRNGVSYSRKDISKAEVLLKMNEAVFTKIYNNMATIKSLIEGGEVEVAKGTVERAEELMSFYDVIFDWTNDKGLQFLGTLIKAIEEEKAKYT